MLLIFYTKLIKKKALNVHTKTKVIYISIKRFMMSLLQFLGSLFSYKNFIFLTKLHVYFNLKLALFLKPKTTLIFKIIF